MVEFLSLPRELRDQIYTNLLHQDTSRPLPTAQEVQRTNTRRDPDDVSAVKVRFSSLPPPTSALSTLSAVNWQVHAEIQQVIAHERDHGVPCLHLDLVLEDLRFYYTTWRYVLPYGSPIRKMMVQIRPFSEIPATIAAGSHNYITPVNRTAVFRQQLFMATFNLGKLLAKFLQHGLGFYAPLNGSARAKVIAVEELVIDIACPSADDEVVSGANSSEMKLERTLVPSSKLAQALEEDMPRSIVPIFVAPGVSPNYISLPSVAILTLTCQGKVVEKFDLTMSRKRRETKEVRNVRST